MIDCGVLLILDRILKDFKYLIFIQPFKSNILSLLNTNLSRNLLFRFKMNNFSKTSLLNQLRIETDKIFSTKMLYIY